MFGQNPIRQQENDDTHLAVEEIFFTLQGEGPEAGRPALFIRLAGCNLACHFCDTQFETQAENPRPVPEILRDILSKHSAQERRFVVLTGGEPLRQNFLTLLDGLLVNGTELVQIETAGTLWIQGLEDYIQKGKVMLVCSPKTPRVHRAVQAYCNHWKYIVRAGELGEDGLPRRGTQQATKDMTSHIFRPLAAFAATPREALGTIWLSPCDDYDFDQNEANKAEAVASCMKHGYRLSLQMHKIVGVR